jgi:hypothetical protein
MKSSLKSIDLMTISQPDAPAQNGLLALLHQYEWTIYISVLFINDLLWMSFAFWVAFYIRFEAYLPIFRLDVIPSKSFYQTIVLVLVPLWLIIFPFLSIFNCPAQ